MAVHIDEPFHGAVINHRHGTQGDGELRLTVQGRAGLDERVTVQGEKVRRQGEAFAAEIALRHRETDIVARADGPAGSSAHRVRVLWDRHSRPRYRFSVDDNSFFLRDVAQQGYRSLFDCFYLAGLRDLHQKYGARFVLNIYYATEDGFELPSFPDRYRGEWADCAHWLKLAFHARANKPDWPYLHASAEQLAADFDQVAEQILRFAGEAAYSPPTVIHWGMVQPSALPCLYERGVRALSGFFLCREGHWTVNYRLDAARSEYLSRHDALVDFDSGITFSNVDLVCNNTPVDRIAPQLDPLPDDPARAEIVDLFTHEQYFWPFYANYLPDHPKRLDAAIRWVTDHGYQPVFFHEGLLGGRH